MNYLSIPERPLDPPEPRIGEEDCTRCTKCNWRIEPGDDYYEVYDEVFCEECIGDIAIPKRWWG